ncbi:ComEA family DNA-binding protein [Castellaniella hirudinis]|uniref:ComEA family DNA-binding protein n=1 Tax=Castellaniella hirudinis TaxID=1144617 RepID=UPI0039C3136C
MNPFLHDTVARPGIETPGIHSETFGSPACPSGDGVPCPPATRGRAVGRAVAKARGRRRGARLSRVIGVAALAWAGAAGAVDLNTATLDQLRGIRGIGAKTAQVILDERSRGGRFASFADLSDRVRGIGPRRAQALRSAGLTIDGGGTRLPSAGAGGSPTPGAPSGRPADKP